MTREERHKALHKALTQSQDGSLYYVLIKDNSFITNSQEVAKFYTGRHGYRVYAKCKDGVLIL